ncbi:MAG: hypothetical protein Rhims3KO_23270 [Hyphomicrobiales bacterium]
MNAYVPIIIGAVLPAVLWGITAVFQKMSASSNLGPGLYLTVFGLIICVGGVTFARITQEWAFNPRGAAYAVMAGLSFTLGTGLLSFALWKFDLPIAKVAPILGANVLVPVLIGAVLLGAGNGLDLGRLLVGTALVLVGAAIVTSA